MVSILVVDTSVLILLCQIVLFIPMVCLLPKIGGFGILEYLQIWC